MQLAAREMGGAFPITQIVKENEELKKKIEEEKRKHLATYRNAQATVDHLVEEVCDERRQRRDWEQSANDKSSARMQLECATQQRKIIDVMSRVNKEDKKHQIVMTKEELRKFMAVFRLSYGMDPRVGGSRTCECLIGRHTGEETVEMAYPRSWTYGPNISDLFQTCNEKGTVNCDICNRKLCKKHAIDSCTTDSAYLDLGIPEEATVCTLCWTPEFFSGEVAVEVEEDRGVTIDDIVEGRAKKARFM